MHLYFISRGIKKQEDDFKLFMQTQLFPWKRKNLQTGQEEVMRVQGALRPIQLYEYVFPEESLNEVLTMLNIPSGENGHWGMSKSSQFMLRKALGSDVEPVPEYTKVPTNHYVPLDGIAIYPLGIKKDKKEEIKEWGYEQERL